MPLKTGIPVLQGGEDVNGKLAQPEQWAATVERVKWQRNK